MTPWHLHNGPWEAHHGWRLLDPATAEAGLWLPGHRRGLHACAGPDMHTTPGRWVSAAGRRCPPAAGCLDRSQCPSVRCHHPCVDPACQCCRRSPRPPALTAPRAAAGKQAVPAALVPRRPLVSPWHPHLHSRRLPWLLQAQDYSAEHRPRLGTRPLAPTGGDDAGSEWSGQRMRDWPTGCCESVQPLLPPVR